MSDLSLKDNGKETMHIEVEKGSDIGFVDRVTRASPRAVRRVVLKQDFVLLPLLSFSYFFGYLVSSTVSCVCV